MSDEHRYSDSEIASIFKQAAEIQEAARRKVSDIEGLTLAELQQIGQEAGITPEYIARAAAAVKRADATPPAATFLGLPLGVARTVDLPGPLSDEAWDRLVAILRETFHATGKISRDGSLRQWRNGNLHVSVEPADTGYRLHMRTLNGNMQGGLMGGMLSFVVGLMLVLMLVISGEFMVVMDKTFIVGMFALLGLGSMGVAAYRLPRWAKERRRQMDAIADRAVELAEKAQIAQPESAASQPLDLDTLEDPADEVQTRSQRRSRT